MITHALLVSLLFCTGRAEVTELFNGKDLDGWVAEGVRSYRDGGVERPVWTVQDGLLTCRGRGFGFLRYDRREFGDFELHLEFRMAERCNSGIGIRTRAFDPQSSRATRPSFYSYEIQLIDDAGKAPSVHSSGSLYRYVAPRKNAMRPAGEWNVVDITCIGPRVKVVMNREVLIDVDQQTIEPLRAKPLKGFLCLQNHGGNIAFRDLRIRELDHDAAETPPPPSGR
jgi:hypothetical protein